MKKTAVIMIAVIMTVLTALSLTACAKQGESELTGIEITKMPDKTDYVAGETFDDTGMVVTATYKDGTTKVVTDYTVDKTTRLKIADKKAVVSYNGFTVEVKIIVSQAIVASIEIDESATYSRTMDVSEVIRYKKVWSDGVKDSDWTQASPDDLVSYSIDGNKITLVLKVLAGTAQFDKTVTLNINDDNAISVAELKTKAADDETTYNVEGIVVAICNTIRDIEYVIKDTATDNYIGVVDLESTGKMAENTYVPLFDIGDKVRIPVQLTKILPAEGAETDKAQVKSDDNKILAKYVGGALYETGVIEKNASVAFDKTAATVISTQNELRDFLSAEKRANNAYKLVKLNAPTYYIRYVNGTSILYRFMFEGVTAYADQKIDGKNTSPVFADYNQPYITGDRVGELLVGDAEWAPATWATPGASAKTVYALFVGGNAYYHQFVILGTEDGLTAVSATVENARTEYIVGDEFTLEGAKVVVNYGTDAYGNDITFTMTLDAGMLDSATLPDMNAQGKYTVKGRAADVDFQFEVSVDKVPTAIALNSEPDNKTFVCSFWERDAKAAFAELKATVTYASGNEEIDVTEDMISFEDTAEWNKKKVIVTFWSVKTESEITLSVPDTLTGVEAAKALPASDTVYALNGIVISSAFISGTNASPANGEILVKDKTTGAIIGLKDMGIDKENKLAGLSVGDEIVVPVTMNVTTTTENTSECGKVTAYKATDGNCVVLSKNNSAALNLDSAVTIANQEEFAAFLKDAATRCDNMYKVVKLSGVRFIHNSSGAGLNITFNADATKVGDIQVDGKTPLLHAMNESMTLGDKTYAEILAGEGVNIAERGYDNPVVMTDDVYLVYVGGQGKYYHQFVLLGGEYVQAPAA